MDVDKKIRITRGFFVTFPDNPNLGEDFAGLTFLTGTDSKRRAYIIPSYETFPEGRIPKSKLVPLVRLHLRYYRRSVRKQLEAYRAIA
jgi:hypothetical protein